MRRRLPTALPAALGLIGGYGVAVASGSRAAGGAVLLACGLTCVWISVGRDPRRVTVALVLLAAVAFAASHALALAIGAWPAVIVCGLAVAAACRRLSDARARGPLAPDPRIGPQRPGEVTLP